jgi:DNA invertase Pin-like site-specific DNA recombinase
MTHKLTNQEWEKVRIAFEKGYNISKLAKQLNISRNSIYVYANKKGWINKNFFSRIWNKIR